MAEQLDLLKMQNERLRFYNDDFWELTKFFSGIVTALLSIPFAFLLSAQRPRWWIFVAAAAPLMALVVARACSVVLRRVALGYYAAGASVVVLERALGLHAMKDAQGAALETVNQARRERGRLSVDELFRQYSSRLKWNGEWSRMGVILKLFFIYQVFAVLESGVLLLRGFFGVNVFAMLLTNR